MKRGLILTAALLFLLISTPVFAQTDSTVLEFYGTIQSANASALVINGQLVDIETAQINAPLVAGTVIRVQAIIETDGAITATQIDPVSPGVIPGIVEMDGEIGDLSDTSLWIGAQRVDFSNAQVDGQLDVGQSVRVFAVQTAPGEWNARLVTVIGNLIPPATTPEVVSTPEILPPLATQVVVPPLTTPEVAVPVSTPEVLAPAQTPEVGENFKIEGTLQAVTDADLVVDGQRFFIGSARIDGTLTVGASVSLEIRVINGQWVLQEIKVVGSSGNPAGGDLGGGSSGGHGSDS